jgi:23S rRNA (adenine2030-N6)-methyltransferase
MLQRLLKKCQPFTVLDTHAGAGTYDLTAEAAQKTGEALDGIGRITKTDLPTLSGYLAVIRSCNPSGLRTYPGSPAIVRSFLRDEDALICCELRDDDSALLRERFRDDRRISVHRRDGYEAIRALLPPKIRRGLVFIDPPFEDPDEFQNLANALNDGIRKWRAGMFVAWYPLKVRSGVRVLRTKYRADNPPTLCCEFLREDMDGFGLAGSGLIICNPPWRFEEELSTLCKDLAVALEATRSSFSVEWWVHSEEN